MTLSATVIQRRRNIRLTVLALVGVVLLVLWAFGYRMSRPRILSAQELSTLGAVTLAVPRTFSPFELQDHHGQLFNETRLAGKWSLLFFGYSHCPDICPTTLAEINRMMAGLDDVTRDNIQVVMITVDPERDNTEALAQYVPWFNPEFVGLTGNPYVILKLARELNVVFNKVGEGEDYTVDHSANLILINPKGHYHGFFRPPLVAENLAAALTSIQNAFGS